MISAAQEFHALEVLPSCLFLKLQSQSQAGFKTEGKENQCTFLQPVLFNSGYFLLQSSGWRGWQTKVNDGVTFKALQPS